MNDSFWKIPEQEITDVPMRILKEQAEKLTEETGGLLRGHVEASSFEGDIIIFMSIHVPTLNNYGSSGKRVGDFGPFLNQF